VQEPVGEPLRLDDASVDLDDVAASDRGVEAAELAVHAYAARRDELVRPTARGDTGTGEEGVQAHRPILRR
jgi:hypothetical protein